MAMAVLNHPEYIKKILDKHNTSNTYIKRKRKEAYRLINIFDKKNITRKCSTHGCNNVAARGLLFSRVISDQAWLCECCLNEPKEPLRWYKEINSYIGALWHVADFCGGKASNYQLVIKYLAEAKGLPTRINDDDAIAFFSCKEPVTAKILADTSYETSTRMPYKGIIKQSMENKYYE